MKPGVQTSWPCSPSIRPWSEQGRGQARHLRYLRTGNLHTVGVAPPSMRKVVPVIKSLSGLTASLRTEPRAWPMRGVRGVKLRGLSTQPNLHVSKVPFWVFLPFGKSSSLFTQARRAIRGGHL